MDLFFVLPVIHCRNLGMMGEQAQMMMVVNSPTLLGIVSYKREERPGLGSRRDNLLP